jgi:hypothetical protein
MAATSTPDDLRLASRALGFMHQAAAGIPENTNPVVAAALTMERLKQMCSEAELEACKRVLDSVLATVSDLEDRAVNDPFELPDRLDSTLGSQKEALV